MEKSVAMLQIIGWHLCSLIVANIVFQEPHRSALRGVKVPLLLVAWREQSTLIDGHLSGKAGPEMHYLPNAFQADPTVQPVRTLAARASYSWQDAAPSVRIADASQEILAFEGRRSVARVVPRPSDHSAL